MLDYYFIEEFTHTYFTEVLEKFFGFNIFVFDKFDSELLLPNYKFNYIKNTYYNKSIFLLYNSNKKIYDIIFTKNNEKNKENLYLIIMKYKTFTHFMKKIFSIIILLVIKTFLFKKTDVFGKTKFFIINMEYILHYSIGTYNPFTNFNKINIIIF